MLIGPFRFSPHTVHDKPPVDACDATFRGIYPSPRTRTFMHSPQGSVSRFRARLLPPRRRRSDASEEQKYSSATINLNLKFKKTTCTLIFILGRPSGRIRRQLPAAPRDADGHPPSVLRCAGSSSPLIHLSNGVTHSLNRRARRTGRAPRLDPVLADQSLVIPLLRDARDCAREFSHFSIGVWHTRPGWYVPLSFFFFLFFFPFYNRPPPPLLPFLLWATGFS